MSRAVRISKFFFFLEFAQLGFITKKAFVNICLELDDSITFSDIKKFWDLGLCTPEFEIKVNRVIERLKSE